MSKLNLNVFPETDLNKSVFCFMHLYGIDNLIIQIIYLQD
jgi:hypothetical protein